MSPAPRRRPAAKPAPAEFGLFGASPALARSAVGPDQELANKTCIMIGCGRYPTHGFGRAGERVFACVFHRGFLQFEAGFHE